MGMVITRQLNSGSLDFERRQLIHSTCFVSSKMLDEKAHWGSKVCARLFVEGIMDTLSINNPLIDEYKKKYTYITYIY